MQADRDRPSLIYMYAIVRADQPDGTVLERMQGVDDAAVEELVEGPLAALYSQVSLDVWGPEVLDEHVRNMDWLAPRATQHQQVLAALQAAGHGMLPLPFATLYHQRDTMRELLRARQAELTARLQRLERAEEWTLKIAQDPAVFEQHVERLSPALARAEEQSRVAPPGKAYLLRKQLETLRRGEAALVTTRQSDEIEQRVTPLVEASIREPISRQAGTASDDNQGDTATRLVLKLALLMRQDSRDSTLTQLAAIAEEYGEFGYVFELAGPWPPYSFAGVDSEKDG